ncbi:MAG: hypothetical protein B7Z75_01215 [Acidocella sp. 20-57-95]|nr:MAG: hypothetical protein B7Z75_01215 [Acidocella sp. 20-57-95]HQT65077.1 hypothetical protein [Acidocella sp.]
MNIYGLAATTQDAASLAQQAGPGCVVGFGAEQAGSSNILAPAGLELNAGEANTALRLGRPQYFFTFGNAPSAAKPDSVAPMIEFLTTGSGVGFMAACLAHPALGRTCYQGHVFEAGRWQGDAVRGFGGVLDGGVGLVAHDIVAGGTAAIRRHCSALKEQGKSLALIDCINDDDASAIAQAVAGMTLIGGAAWLAEPVYAAAPPPPAGQIAILSSANDRQSIFQLGAARAVLPALELDVTAPEASANALAWAANAAGSLPFMIATAALPGRDVADGPVADVFGRIASGLADLGVRRLVLCGDVCTQAVLAALGIKRLTRGADCGPLAWLQNNLFSICIKPTGIGPKNLFLTSFEPQLSRNETSE